MSGSYELISHSPTSTKTVTIQNITTLINFKEKRIQNFSFPYYMIEYISKNCNLRSSQKLMKCCKYLRILQVRVGFSHFNIIGLALHKKRRGCNKLNFELRFRIFDDMPLCKAVIEDVDKFMIEFKRIKVWQHLSLYFNQESKYKYEKLIKVLDLSDLKELACNGRQMRISDGIIAHIMQPSFEKIYFDVAIEQGYFNLLYFALEALHHVSDLEITSTNTALSSHQLNALLSIKREQKFNNCKIGCLNRDIDVNDILTFCNTFMELKGTLTLTFFTLGNNPDFITKFRNAKKAQEENNASFCSIVCLVLDQDLNYRFDDYHFTI